MTPSVTDYETMVVIKAVIPLQVIILYRPPPKYKGNGYANDQFIADTDSTLTELSLLTGHLLIMHGGFQYTFRQPR